MKRRTFVPVYMLRNILYIAAFLPLVLRGQQPPGTDILLFDFSFRNGALTLLNPVNITRRTGYDNQPFFHPKQPVLYYTSADENGRTDIIEYNFLSNTSRKLTVTPDREYSPTLTPDKKHISCIVQRDNQAQDLVQYPLNGGRPVILVNHLTVGYHAWTDRHTVALFVLGQPPTLHIFSLKHRTHDVVADSIGRSLHRIPRTRFISFVDKGSKQWMIKKYDPRHHVVVPICPTLPDREDMAWLDQFIVMSDGADLYFIHPGKGATWKKALLPEGTILRNVSRIAIHPRMSKIAVVVADEKQ